MPKHSISQWQHTHYFALENQKSVNRTRVVLIFTVLTMGLEIIAGIAFGSMALLSDGIHMVTHATAFIITLLAYHYSKKNKDNPSYTFGPGKISVLGGYTSAVVLLLVAFTMAFESVRDLFYPKEILFNEAIFVALLGLLVNIISAFLLHDGKHKHEKGDLAHGHAHDHSLKAAYIHVLSDALTSILAIFALLAGKYFQLIFMDSLMGIAGAVMIVLWAHKLIKETSSILLDKNTNGDLQDDIRQKLESMADTYVSDLHVWQVGPKDRAVIVSLVTHSPQSVEFYKQVIGQVHDYSHLSVEINICRNQECMPSISRLTQKEG
jgi:cation diffusion facilitator family transporter